MPWQALVLGGKGEWQITTRLRPGPKRLVLRVAY